MRLGGGQNGWASLCYQKGFARYAGDPPHPHPSSKVFISFLNAPRHLLTPRGAGVLSHKEKIILFPIFNFSSSLIFFIR